MDDMTAFERQVQRRVHRFVGPARPVDDLAVFEAVAAASRSHRWGFTMFSALKFVAAAAIVALFGGFLLAGVLTTQQDGEVAPAAVTESPSPMTTEELLSGMVTEEVEPGVLRVVNDGLRDLGALGGSWGNHGGVTIGADGAVWVHTANGRYFRVGEALTRELPKEFLDVEDANAQAFGANALYAGPTGQLWAKDAKSGRVNVWMHDEWLERADLFIDSMAVDGSNEAWAASQWGLLRVDAEGETLIAWPDDPTHEVTPYTLDVSADGRSYVLSGPVKTDPESGFLDTLLRYDGTRWTEIPLPTPISVFFPGDGMAVGADGTVWVAGDDHGDTDYMHHSLARLDGSEWTVFTADDGVQPWGGKEGFLPEETIGVSTDGSVWVDASTLEEGWWADCDGVARFDGTSWSPYLAGHCLVDIDFAPDGSAWALASASNGGHVNTYVITPEAERDALVAANAISEVLATVEGSTEAVNAYDTEAIRTYVTEDYTWQSTGPVTALDEYLSYVDAYYEQLGFHVVSGEPVVRADGEVYIVEVPDVATFSGRELIGTTVHRVVADGDGWLIQESRWTEDTPETTD